jgi:hypothetical protein
VWTGLQEAPDAYFDCFAPEIKEVFQAARAGEAAKAGCGISTPQCSCGSEREKIHTLRVFDQKPISDNENQLEYKLDVAGGESPRLKQPFRRIGDAWKISGPPQEV